MTGKEVANGLVEICRDRKEIDQFIDTFLREHRTNQQSIGGNIIFKLIAILGGNFASQTFDLRNEKLVEICSKVRVILEEEGVVWTSGDELKSYLPYI